MGAKKRQTMGKLIRERERAEKRARKQEKKEAKKALAAMEHEPAQPEVADAETVAPSEPSELTASAPRNTIPS